VAGGRPLIFSIVQLPGTPSVREFIPRRLLAIRQSDFDGNTILFGFG
jgi:hypothetical protein